METIPEEKNIEEKIQMILRQTNYTEEEARNKLEEYNDEPILVIKDFLGIPLKESQTRPVRSINQEIYKQLRYKLDHSMRDYQNRKREDKKV
jgi:Glu-tRNA(Gln) amidotransferase subunit E-like FAD-binding protein